MKTRRPNWTKQESLFLAQLIEVKKNIIRGNRNTGVTKEEKRDAWEQIVQSLNCAFPQIERTVADCYKKWKNLLCKAKDEIKKDKGKSPEDPDFSTEKFSSVTEIVLRVMNPSIKVKQEDCCFFFDQTAEDSTESNTKDETCSTTEDFADNKMLLEVQIPVYSHPSTPEHKVLTNGSKSLTGHCSSPEVNIFSENHQMCNATPLLSAQYEKTAATQEKLELQMSVLRRQDKVLKLQEEYYAMKIKLLKKQMSTLD